MFQHDLRQLNTSARKMHQGLKSVTLQINLHCNYSNFYFAGV